MASTTVRSDGLRPPPDGNDRNADENGVGQTKKRFGNVATSSNGSGDDPPRITHGAPFGSGFGNGGNGWQNGGIWANTIGSGMRTGSIDIGRMAGDTTAGTGHADMITGSGSLLSSSESDHWDGRRTTPWRSISNASPTRSSSHTNRSGTSPMRRQSSSQLIAPPFTEPGPGSSSYFTINPGATTLGHGMPGKTARKTFLDPTSGTFTSATALDPTPSGPPSRLHGDDESRYPPTMLAVAGDIGWRGPSGRPAFPSSYSGYASSTASRSGSIPPARMDAELPSRRSETAPYAHPGPSAPLPVHRPHPSTPSSYAAQPASYGKHIGDRSSPTQLSVLTRDFGKMAVGPETGNPDGIHPTEPRTMNRHGFEPEYVHRFHQPDGIDPWLVDENGYQTHPERFIPNGVLAGATVPPHAAQYRGLPPFSTTYSPSSESNDPHRAPNGQFYSTSGTPSSGAQPAIHHRTAKGDHPLNGMPNGQATALDRNRRGSHQMLPEPAGFPSSPNPVNFRVPFGPYDFHPHGALRMNPLAPYYQMPPVSTLLTPPTIPRGPAREHDISQHVRSPLLEEFRNNSKTNKRYELKDIFNHIVEFSGDQHGSRFIQQKLETANSDEKDQVFREIHLNSLQLMTDVFGNYVIQKFFEHGNQAQKKILANQMKNHILTLSLQMYGCRVVQKALEHILTDQQAQLVKELEQHVLKCVKDQNGNHVIQKAIERVPAVHIQFIINAFTGQVHGLAMHPYGCRVIQRMLEHCEEPTRSAVLHELHACAASLIIDQYGNYVTQHVIEHGREEDRTKIISLITGNLANLSKHKFASNVVEKSIQFGTAAQRQKIIDILTVLNDKGESPLQSLIRDQYGNYVIQKLLAQLKDDEFDRFVELVKPQLALLKRFSYGKQIAAIEKMVYQPGPTPLLMPHHRSMPTPINTSAAPTPPLVMGDGQSPQSSSHPSTNASSINGAADSCKSSSSNTVAVLTPAST